MAKTADQPVDLRFQTARVEHVDRVGDFNYLMFDDDKQGQDEPINPRFKTHEAAQAGHFDLVARVDQVGGFYDLMFDDHKEGKRYRPTNRSPLKLLELIESMISIIV